MRGRLELSSSQAQLCPAAWMGWCGPTTPHPIALAPFRAHIQLHNLGAVAVAHRLRVCYPENADPGAFFFAFALQGAHFLLESCSAAPILKFQATSAHVPLRYAKRQLTEI